MKTKDELIPLLESKHFCILPWIHFHAWPNGNVMPCCVADSTMPVSKIKADESVMQMLNAEDYKKMRLAMLNDEPSAACKRCYDLEELGTWTLRKSHNKVRGLREIDAVAATNDDGSIDAFKMKYMDIRFSNICNMKCRSCGPACSSLWAEEKLKIHGVENLEKYFGTRKIVINNNEDDAFLTKLLPHLDEVEEVYFAGGESLITQEHYDCLDYWIKNGLNKKVELTYTTNFSSLKFKQYDLIAYWKKFPALKIWASLDADGEHAELMRKGTNWDRVIKNIKQVRESCPHAIFQITPTISIWNIYTFPAFFDRLIEQGLISRNTIPRFNMLTDPWWANVMILPQFAKDELSILYKHYSEKYADNHSIANGFKTIEYAIATGSPNKGGIVEFIKMNDDLDNIRNEGLLITCPELKEVYEWAKS